MTFDEMQLIMQQVVINQRETQDIVKSIARGIQAMQDKALTDELKSGRDCSYRRCYWVAAILELMG
jgi:hypothetical protein